MSLVKSAVLCSAAAIAFAQAPAPDRLNQLRFRYIGPVGNRVISAAGIPRCIFSLSRNGCAAKGGTSAPGTWFPRKIPDERPIAVTSGNGSADSAYPK